VAKPVKPTRLEIKQAQRAARSRWIRTRETEQTFQRSLSNVARQVGKLVKDMAPGGKVTMISASRLENILIDYSNILKPWARAVTQSMHARVDLREQRAWRELSDSMGKAIREELKTAETGEALRILLHEQAELITSIPIKAAHRIHDITVGNLVTADRGEGALEEMIMSSGDVSLSHARMIARTETARTASVLTEVRAVHLDSPGYFWRTVRDTDVRPRHKKLEGNFYEWNNPPVSGEDGERSHPGQIYNCRCYPEPVLPEIA
jgi:SPP1 gp7 family putative phage head morphogenesis protein